MATLEKWEETINDPDSPIQTTLPHFTRSLGGLLLWVQFDREAEEEDESRVWRWGVSDPEKPKGKRSIKTGRANTLAAAMDSTLAVAMTRGES